jgi:hypothetical protein
VTGDTTGGAVEDANERRPSQLRRLSTRAEVIIEVERPDGSHIATICNADPIDAHYDAGKEFMKEKLHEEALHHFDICRDQLKKKFFAEGHKKSWRSIYAPASRSRLLTGLVAKEKWDAQSTQYRHLDEYIAYCETLRDKPSGEAAPPPLLNLSSIRWSSSGRETLHWLNELEANAVDPAAVALQVPTPSLVLSPPRVHRKASFSQPVPGGDAHEARPVLQTSFASEDASRVMLYHENARQAGWHPCLIDTGTHSMRATPVTTPSLSPLPTPSRMHMLLRRNRIPTL